MKKENKEAFIFVLENIPTLVELYAIDEWTEYNYKVGYLTESLLGALKHLELNDMEKEVINLAEESRKIGEMVADKIRALKTRIREE